MLNVVFVCDAGDRHPNASLAPDAVRHRWFAEGASQQRHEKSVKGPRDELQLIAFHRTAEGGNLSGKVTHSAAITRSASPWYTREHRPTADPLPTEKRALESRSTIVLATAGTCDRIEVVEA